MMAEQSEWVTLSEAAEILGVHPSTVRHWADSGELPSQRTRGGHRRFRRRDLEQWTASRRRQMAPAEAQLVLQSALGRARLEIGGGQLEGQAWYARLDEEARQKHRTLGRRLLEVLTRYLADPENHEAMMKDIRTLGTEYAALSQAQKLGLLDAVRAFLFFRDLVADSMIQLAEALSLRTPLEWGDRLRQVNHMTDELLLVLIEQFEECAKRQKGSEDDDDGATA